jgi:Flp pilus assembly protein TadD
VVDVREKVANELLVAAGDLERAAAHCREAANHFRSREVPRGCAHSLAARGDFLKAEQRLDRLTLLHSYNAALESEMR